MKHRIGVVGLGARADKVLPDALRHSAVELMAVCDVDANRNVASHAVPVFTSYEEMLDKIPLDFIVVMTPHNSHLSIVKAAARRGVHVLKEKPFARNLDEAAELQTICDQADIHLMTSLPRRFNPNYVLLHDWRHRVGQMHFAEFRYTKFVEQPGHGWRGDTSLAGGGCILDMGYHMIDLIIWNLALPDRVHASISASAVPSGDYDAEDTALVAFGYTSGLHGSLTLSRFLPAEEYVRLVGPEGILEATPKELRFLRSDGALVDSKALCNERSAMAEQLDYFSGVIRDEHPNFASPSEHLLHAKLVNACYTSHKQDGNQV